MTASVVRLRRRHLAGRANVVYERGTHSFAPRRADGEIRDTDGRRWRTIPDALVSETGERLARVPAAHRAFLFGWIAQRPETVLYT